MATVTVALPRPQRRVRNPRVGGRARIPDVYFVKPIDNSRLWREVDVKKLHECYALLGLLVLIFGVMFVYAWQHFECVRYGYQIEQMKQQQASLEEWNRKLRLEQAALEDPGRIDRLAQKQLGLVTPDPRQVVPVSGPQDTPVQIGNPQFAENEPVPEPAAREIDQKP